MSKKSINVKVDNIVGWPDQGIVYIADGAVAPGIYSFKKSKSKKVPVPIYIKEYKNRVRLSKKTIKEIEDNL